MATMKPFLIAMSASNRGLPLPSRMVPFRMTASNCAVWPWIAVAAAMIRKSRSFHESSVILRPLATDELFRRQPCIDSPLSSSSPSSPRRVLRPSTSNRKRPRSWQPMPTGRSRSKDIDKFSSFLAPDATFTMAGMPAVTRRQGDSRHVGRMMKAPGFDTHLEGHARRSGRVRRPRLHRRRLRARR